MRISRCCKWYSIDHAVQLLLAAYTAMQQMNYSFMQNACSTRGQTQHQRALVRDMSLLSTR